jgi:hypothetical protein
VVTIMTLAATRPVLKFSEVVMQKIAGLLAEQDRPTLYDPGWDDRDDPVPAWIIAVHVFFMRWTIFNAHHPELFIPGLLFFLGFAQVTEPFQNRIDLKPPLLVGFFLGGLVVHGGVQGWWIEPVLGKLSEMAPGCRKIMQTAIHAYRCWQSGLPPIAFTVRFYKDWNTYFTLTWIAILEAMVDIILAVIFISAINSISGN